MALPRRRFAPTIAVFCFVVSCDERSPAAEQRAEAQPSCNAFAVRDVVQRLGERLKAVSLLAPDSIVVREIRISYEPLVTPELLNAWIANPAQAPGRAVSSPWPDRIEVQSVDSAGARECRVDGHVAYLTSAERTPGAAASRIPVTLRVRANGEWRVSTYDAPEPALTDSSSASAAVEVLRRYFAALAARDFRRAYALWGNRGAASGRTFEEFTADVVETKRVAAEIGEPSRVEPAAESRYIEAPVVVRVTTATGTEQRLEGTYVLRHSVVPGATADERRRHIYSEKLVRTN